MRIIFILCLLPLPYFGAYAQYEVLSQTEFEDTLEAPIHIYKKLKVKDTNSVIVAIDRVGVWTYGQYSDYYIFYPNGKIKAYQEFRTSNKKQKKSYFKKLRLTSECSDSALHFLNNSLSPRSFQFNSDSLAIMPEPVVTENGVQIINTTDGLYYTLFVVQARKYIQYKTRSPEPLVYSKCKGWREKQRFLELIRSFDQFRSCDEK